MLQMQLLTLPQLILGGVRGNFRAPPPFRYEINVTERKAHCTAARWRGWGGVGWGGAGGRESGHREEKRGERRTG